MLFHKLAPMYLTIFRLVRDVKKGGIHILYYCCLKHDKDVDYE